MVALFCDRLDVRLDLIFMPVAILKIEANGITGEPGIDDGHSDLSPAGHMQSWDCRANTRSFQAGA